MIWLLIGYMFLFIHRPFEVWPILGTIRLELIYMLMTIAVWSVQPKRWPGGSIGIALPAFAGAVVVAGLLSPWRDVCWVTVDIYLKILVFFILLVTTIHDERSLKQLILGFVVVMAVFLLHSLREFHAGRFVYRMGIPRMIGVGVSASDPNTFAAGIVLALVFVPTLWQAYGKHVRLFLLGFVGLSVLCISLTGSRGAFVLLALWALVAVLRSQYRWGLMLAGVLAVPVFWSVLPAGLQNRFETIIDPSVGPANAQMSADGRIEGLKIGVQLWLDNPVVGVGPGAWIEATGREIHSHNLYGQLLGETGTLGALTFVGFVLALVLNVRWLRQASRPAAGEPADFIYNLAGAVGLAVFLMLVQGNFGHNLFRYNWVWYAAFLMIARQIVCDRLAEHEWLAWTEAWPTEEWQLAEESAEEIYEAA